MKLKSFFSALAILITASAVAQNPMAIPDTLNGTSFNLNIYDSSRVFYAGFTTNTYGINGAYLGPTLLLKKGDSVSMNVNNTLMDTTTIHWHGLHVSSKNDGGPHTVIPPGNVWNPKFKIRDHAGTYWYHPHLHMMTNLQATKGAAGLIIVRDSAEATLNLPRRYSIDDFPLVIQSKAFDGSKQIVVNNAYDSVMMVNGTLKPYLQVPAQVVRLRLLNASSERVYNCGFTGNLTFYQIGSDGGLLQNPVSMTRLRLGPGERAELLLNLTGMQTQTLNLMSFGAEFPSGIYGAANPAAMGGGTIPGYSSNVLNGANFPILNLQVVAQTTNAVTTIPSTLIASSPWNTASATVTRTLTFSPQTMGPNQMVNGPFVINSSPFNMNVINYNIPKDNIEIWQLTNNTAIAHPFHIHDIQFYIFDVNGSVPPLNMQGRKDVVLVPSQQTIKFITKFENFCDSVPYMYHCHMLKHEDEGMMGQFVVQCAPTIVINNSTDSFSFSVFPNPASELFEIEVGETSLQVKINIYDLHGKEIFRSISYEKSFKVDVADWKKGMYVAEFTSGDKRLHRKVMVQ